MGENAQPCDLGTGMPFWAVISCAHCGRSVTVRAGFGQLGLKRASALGFVSHARSLSHVLSCYYFDNPNKTVKATLGSQIIDKQAAESIWPPGCSLPPRLWGMTWEFRTFSLMSGLAPLPRPCWTNRSCCVDRSPGLSTAFLTFPALLPPLSACGN